MHWLTRLERRYPDAGIPDLITYVVAVRFLTFMVAQANPAYPAFLAMDPDAVRAGEVWRLVTFIFLPSSGSVFWLLFELLWTRMLGQMLEATWGTFRFTVFYAIGTIMTSAAALFITGETAYPTFLDLSQFLAVATLAPNMVIRVFFILPVEIKWLGLLAALGLGVLFFQPGMTVKALITASLLNYLLFLWSEVVQLPGRFAAGIRRRPVSGNWAPPSLKEPRHRCVICGTSERDDRDLEFRWCSCPRCKPDGREFCRPHLEEHLKA